MRGSGAFGLMCIKLSTCFGNAKSISRETGLSHETNRHATLRPLVLNAKLRFASLAQPQTADGPLKDRRIATTPESKAKEAGRSQGGKDDA